MTAQGTTTTPTDTEGSVLVDASVSATEQMARSTLRAAIDAARVTPSVANFVVRGQDLQTGTPFRIDFEADVAEEVISDVVGFSRTLADRELIPYDPSIRPSTGQALFDDLPNVPELALLHRQVVSQDPPIDVAHRAEVPGPIVGLVHRVDGAVDLPITAYRFKGPGIATKRASGLRLLLPRGGIWMRVPEELLYYQPRFDALVVGEVVLVTAPSTLQRTLGSDERARRMARDTFRSATERIDIEGRIDLADAVGSDPAMIAKMAQLNRTLEAEPSYAEHLTTGRLLRFLDENRQIDIATDGEGAARHLVFESSPQKRYLIPKMLADDFLRSDLTDRRYEAGSKHRIDGRAASGPPDSSDG